MILEITRKRLFIFGSFLVVLIAIPLTVYLSQRQQESRSQASAVPEDRVIVTIDGADYTKADIREVASEQYEATAVDDQALKDALDVLIERKILEIEAERLSVETDSDYEIFRDNMIIAATKSRRVLSLGFWSPKPSDQTNLDESEKQLAQTLTTQGRLALSEIESRLNAGADILTIVNSIITRYPVLKDYIALNGSRLTDLSEEEKRLTGRSYTVEFGDSNMDASVLNGLFSLSQGQVRKFQATETNDAGSVFKVVEIGNDSGPSTYSRWLSERKSALVTPRGSL